MRPDGSRAFGVVIAIASLLAFFPSSPAFPKTNKAPATHRPAAGATGAPIAAFAGPCDTASITDVFPDLESKDHRNDTIALLQGRIIACSQRIAGVLASMPTASPAPYWISDQPLPAQIATPAPVCIASPPPATSASSTIAMYETLSRCFNYLTYLTTLPSPDPTSSPPARVASRPTFYVYAVGAVDTPTAAVLIRSILERLTKALQPSADLVLAGRGDWVANDNFAAQCQLDPNTRDALVIQTSIPQVSTLNYVLLTTQVTRVSASVEMLGCSSEDHNPASSPVSLVNANGITGKAHETALTLGLFESIGTFLFTSKSTTTVSAGPPATLSHVEQSAPAANGNLLSYYQGQNLNLPAQNASVQLTVAGERFAADAMSRLHLLCVAPALGTLAAEARPGATPEHRTVRYKAAALYSEDCDRFRSFF